MHNIKGILNTEQIKKRNLSNFQEGPKKKKKTIAIPRTPIKAIQAQFPCINQYESVSHRVSRLARGLNIAGI